MGYANFYWRLGLGLMALLLCNEIVHAESADQWFQRLYGRPVNQPNGVYRKLRRNIDFQIKPGINVIWSGGNVVLCGVKSQYFKVNVIKTGATLYLVNSSVRIGHIENGGKVFLAGLSGIVGRDTTGTGLVKNIEVGPQLKERCAQQSAAAKPMKRYVRAVNVDQSGDLNVIHANFDKVRSRDVRVRGESIFVNWVTGTGALTFMGVNTFWNRPLQICKKNATTMGMQRYIASRNRMGPCFLTACKPGTTALGETCVQGRAYINPHGRFRKPNGRIYRRGIEPGSAADFCRSMRKTYVAHVGGGKFKEAGYGRMYHYRITKQWLAGGEPVNHPNRVVRLICK